MEQLTPPEKEERLALRILRIDDYTAERLPQGQTTS